MRLVDGDSAPLELHGTGVRLFVRQVIVVKDGDYSTESYVYRLQADESADSWLIRWEYQREPLPSGNHAGFAVLGGSASGSFGRQTGGSCAQTRHLIGSCDALAGKRASPVLCGT